MLRLNPFHSRLRLFSCLALSLVAPVWAQSNLTAPHSWTKSVAAGDTVFVEPDSKCRIVIKKLSPLNGSAQSWFEDQAEADSQRRGTLTSPGKLGGSGQIMTLIRGFRSTSGAQSVVYTGYPVGDQGRLIVYSGPTSQALLRNIPVLKELIQQTSDLDKAGRSNTSSTSSIKKSDDQKTPIFSTKAMGTTKKLSPVAARGTLKSSQIMGVYLSESYTGGVGGMVVLVYNPVLLLRDGSARRDLDIPPLDVNLAQDRAAHARDWGRWTRSGDKIKVRWSAKDSDEIKASFKTRPARPGETLGRGYTSLGGGGNTALGGDVMVFYSNSYIFARDGRFATKSSGGGGSSSITALSSSKNGGRYRLDGHALTLKFNDGRQVRKLFYFYPNDNKADVIGIGDSAFIGDD